MRLSDDLEYVTTRQAARILHVSEGRIAHFLSDGRLKSRLVLGRRLILKDDVWTFARNRPLKPGPVTGSRHRGRKASRT